MTYRPSTANDRKQARIVLSERAQIREVFREERGRRGKARTKYVVVAR